LPIVATYSIVACDPGRGEWGVGVQSKFLAVGSLVAWAKPGVGAIATQALAKVSYGPDGLELLARGLPATEVVQQLTSDDEGRDHRQLGVVDGRGGAATYTGAECLSWAGGTIGSGYAAQGNILVSEATVAALADSYERSAGDPLARRLLSALAAAQDAGGDRRGQQSAALLVVRAGGGYDGCGVLVDLRVDDHPTPIAELERLYGLHQLYFGETPAEQWIAVDETVEAELRDRLARLGHATGDLRHDLETWAGIENLEERIDGVERVDPVVLEELRRR
jgi:uncharacterized Ntn-hydrolase superfamily protein